jgi:hypothetical protein
VDLATDREDDVKKIEGYMILQIGDIEKAFGLATEDGRGALPQIGAELIVMYRSLRHGGIDAIEALRGICAFNPRSVTGILQLLGDDDIDDVAKLVEEWPERGTTLAKSIDIMRAWATRQTVLRLLRQHGFNNLHLMWNIN